jgi:hypothetical protein
LAIAHAHRILGWQENLLSEEQPPQWMWPFESELELWFEEVDQKREERYGGSEGSSSGESVPMMTNELVGPDRD